MPNCRPAIFASLGALVALALACPATAAEGEALGQGIDFDFRHWGTDEGLPNDTTTSAVAGPDGHLWIGTSEGLLRFDGVAFTPVPLSGGPIGPYPEVVNLLVDSEQRVWVSAQEGMAVLQNGMAASGTWNSGWPRGETARNWVEFEGRIFAAGESGQCFVYDGASWQPVPSPSPTEENQPCFLAVDTDGVLIGLQAGTLSQWQHDGWQPISLADGDEPGGMTAARGGGVWIAARNHVTRIRRGTAVSSVSVPDANQSVWTMHEDARGVVWMATSRHGLKAVLPANGSVQRFGGDGEPAGSLKFVLSTVAGSVWIGSRRDGVYQAFPRRFSLLRPPPGTRLNDLHSDADGRLLAATSDGGVLLVDTNGKMTTHPDFPAEKLPEAITTAATDSHGRLWAAGIERLVMLARGGEAETVMMASDQKNRFTALLPMRDGTVFIGGLGGLAQWKDGTVTWHGDGTGTEGFREPIHCFAAAPDGGAFAGGQRGLLVRYNSGSWEALEHNESPTASISAMVCTPDGALWIGTHGQGLWRWWNRSLRPVPLRDSTHEHAVLPAITSCGGYLWLASRKCLIRVDPEAAHRAADGLIDCAPALYRGSEQGPQFGPFRMVGEHPMAADGAGFVWITGSMGLIRADPRAEVASTAPLGAGLERVVALNPLDGRPEVSNLSSSHVFQAGTRHVEFSYTAPMLLGPDKVRYRYRMDGNPWVDAGGRTEAIFEDLSPGHHTFHVSAAVRGQDWEGGPAEVRFEIKPFWWQRSEVRVAGIVLLGSVMAGTGWLLNARRAERQRAIMTGRQALLAERAAALEREQLLQSQLREAQKLEAVGQLAGGVAHDFNNLLQVIQGYTQIARQPGTHPDDRERDLAEVARAAERASQLTRQLLAFSRKHPMEFRDLDLNEVVGRSLKMLQRLIGTHIQVEFMPQCPGATVSADDAQIDQILMNLAVNARDAMHDGGKLTVGITVEEFGRTAFPAWAQPGKWVRLTVGDTGHGMDDDTRQRIFDPFFTTKPQGKGTGLGLSVVYGVVTHHEGFLHVESSPGRGSAFHVFLPFRAPAMKAVAPQAAVQVTFPARPVTILMADDEPAILHLAQLALKRAGHHVVAVGSGVEAVSTFAADPEKVDLVMLDILMPQMTGWGAAERIRAVKPDVPILFCSGFTGGASDELPEDHLPPQSAVLYKPYTIENLLLAVQQLRLVPDSSA